MTGDPHTDHELHAYIDGELPEDKRVAFEQLIADDPKLAERVALFRADKARIASFYGRVISAPLPLHWIELIEKRPRRLQQAFTLKAIARIAVVLLLLIGAGLAYRHIILPREPIVEEALAARSGALSLRRIAVLTSPAPKVAGQAASSALAIPVAVPDLGRLAYTLTGLQIFGGVPGGKAVELLYRRDDGHLFAVYIRRPTSKGRFDEFTRENLRVCFWQDNVVGAVMSGEMPAAEIERLATVIWSAGLDRP